MFANVKRFIARMRAPTHTIVHVDNNQKSTPTPKNELTHESVLTAAHVLYYRLLDDYIACLQRCGVAAGPPGPFEFESVEHQLDECDRLLELIKKAEAEHRLNAVKSHVRRFNKIAEEAGYPELFL